MRSLAAEPSNSVPQFRLPVFEGPLDLLLHLIREREIEIYDIPIAEIARQYLDYLDMMEELNLAVAGEYLVIAATLVEIKSRMLLPRLPSTESVAEEEDPRAELVEKLLAYQRYQGTVETLREWEAERLRLYFRGALENPEDYVLPISEGEMTGAQLLAALKRVLESAGVDESAVTAVVPRRRVSLRLKMAEVLRRVRATTEGISFGSLFEPPVYRYDVVLTFLALLELLRLLRVRAEQRHPNDDIILFPAQDAE